MIEFDFSQTPTLYTIIIFSWYLSKFFLCSWNIFIYFYGYTSTVFSLRRRFAIRSAFVIEIYDIDVIMTNVVLGRI